MTQKIIIASGPVIVEDRKVLVTKHGDTPFWKFCGGTTQSTDENFRATACREAREEVGVELEFLDAQPFFMYVQKEKSDGVYDVLLVHWLAKRHGEVKPQRDDIREWAWLPIDALPDDIGPNIIPALKHFGFLK